MWRDQSGMQGWGLQPHPAWFICVGGRGNCAELGLLDRVSQKGFCLGARKESAGLCGYIARRQIQSSLSVQPGLLQEREHMPAPLLPSCGTTPNKRLFGSALQSPRYPSMLGAVPWAEERAAQRRGIQSVRLLEAIAWDWDKVLSLVLQAGLALFKTGNSLDLSL